MQKPSPPEVDPWAERPGFRVSKSGLDNPIIYDIPVVRQLSSLIATQIEGLGLSRLLRVQGNVDCRVETLSWAIRACLKGCQGH